MKAMVLEQIKCPLKLKEVSKPIPGPFELLVKVKTCGVCRTDLHIYDGELEPHLPLILGHQIVGIVEEIGRNASKFAVGDRIGIPWLGGSCHTCEYCLSNRENLCLHAVFTGYSRNGGYAEFCTAHEDYVLKLPEVYDDLHAAPLLCAGIIGFRAFRLIQPTRKIGLYGFGSSAHLLIQAIKQKGQETYVFTRPGDKATQAFALSLGANWAGGSDTLPPTPLDGAIIFAPVGQLYIEGLKAVKKGGKVISAGIHMSDIPSFPYALLWEERSLSSVANLTRQDGVEFMELAAQADIQVSVNRFPLEEANEALQAIKHGKKEGSVVLTIS